MQGLANITVHDVLIFIWENVICRFRFTDTIIFYNGKQFDIEVIITLYSAFGIKIIFSTLYHSYDNGKVEAINKTLLDILKTPLKDTWKKWLEQLPTVLWTYCPIPKHSTRLSPFHLNYGYEAILLIEVVVLTSQT